MFGKVHRRWWRQHGCALQSSHSQPSTLSRHTAAAQHLNTSQHANTQAPLSPANAHPKLSKRMVMWAHRGGAHACLSQQCTEGVLQTPMGHPTRGECAVARPRQEHERQAWLTDSARQPGQARPVGRYRRPVHYLHVMHYLPNSTHARLQCCGTLFVSEQWYTTAWHAAWHASSERI